MPKKPHWAPTEEPAWEKGANIPGVGRVKRRQVRIAGEVDIACLILPEEGALLVELGLEGCPPGVKVRIYGYGAGSSLAQRSRSSPVQVAVQQLGNLTDLYFDAGTVPDYRPNAGMQGSLVARVQRSDELDEALGRVARALRACASIDTLTPHSQGLEGDPDLVWPGGDGEPAKGVVMRMAYLDEDGCVESIQQPLSAAQAKAFAVER